MSLAKRSFILTCCIISALLLTLNVVTFFLFRYHITKQLLNSQNALIHVNNTQCKLFTQEVDQLSYFYTSDEELGRLLSMPIHQDSLEDSQTKIALNNQMIYIMNTQSILSNKGFSTVLYINPELPVSDLFTPDTTVATVSRLFNAESIINKEWYQKTLEQNSRQYIFLDQAQNRICFAKKLQNSHYTGPFQKNGLGILLGYFSIDRISQLFTFQPLTKNSGFVLLNREGDSLYQSKSLLHFHEVSLNSIKDNVKTQIVLDGETYIGSSTELDWGLTLLFLTPYSDISQQLYAIMLPYFCCSVLFLMIGAVSSLLLSRSIARPVTQFSKKLEGIEDIRSVDLSLFSSHSDSSEIRRLNDSFRELLYRINKLTVQIEKEAEQRRLSELKALQAQMNPHFMLNAMNAVNYMALSRGEDDIASTVDSIAKLMRYSITEPDQLVNLQTELENIREYISIYTLRFRQNIHLDIDTDRSELEIFIPKFTLQPLVENSIRHGISLKETGITVQIKAWQKEEVLYIQVTDTGKGADPQKLNAYLNYENVELKVSHGFGIRNVNERLRLHFGEKSGLSYSTNCHGTLTAQIVIDLNKKNTLYKKK